MKVILDSHLMVERLHADIDHGRKDFNRLAARELAKALLGSGCLITRTEFDIRTGMYHSVIDVLFASKERRLP